MTTEAAAAVDAGTSQDAGATQAIEAATTTEAPAAEQDAGSEQQTQPAESAQAEAKQEEKPAAKAPEKYEFKAEEGKEFSPDVLQKFEEIARELDLSQEGAQKMLDTIAPQIVKAQEAAHAKIVSDWADQAKADKEIGGEKFAENLAVAKKALETFGTPELREVLDKSGLGNHPELIRAFMRAGQKISSASFVPAGRADTTPTQTAGAKLYPDMK